MFIPLVNYNSVLIDLYCFSHLPNALSCFIATHPRPCKPIINSVVKYLFTTQITPIFYSKLNNFMAYLCLATYHGYIPLM